jgi:hypothetical protein
MRSRLSRRLQKRSRRARAMRPPPSAPGPPNSGRALACLRCASPPPQCTWPSEFLWSVTSIRERRSSLRCTRATTSTPAVAFPTSWLQCLRHWPKSIRPSRSSDVLLFPRDTVVRVPADRSSRVQNDDWSSLPRSQLAHPVSRRLIAGVRDQRMRLLVFVSCERIPKDEPAMVCMALGSNFSAASASVLL